MLVLSNSMCKSASSVLFWYTRQLVEKLLSANAQQKLVELTASGELPGVNEFVNPVTPKVLDRLVRLADEFGPTVVKTHTPPTPYLQALIEQGIVKVTFCFRDPRDMILSAIDHRRRSENDGKPVFTEFTTVLESLDTARWWCQMACDWIQSELPLLFRYDSIVKRPGHQIRRIGDYLELFVEDEVIDQILTSEQQSRRIGNNEFNRGQLVRYPLEMTRTETEACNRELGDLIERLGFFVNNSFESSSHHLSAKEHFRRLRNLAKKLILTHRLKSRAA